MGTWDTFESTLEVAEAARGYIEPQYETPIRVLVGENVITMELEVYLQSVLPAELFPNWPMECLKAQAVASRSYAMWRIAHPRSNNFDLYADSRDQMYTPGSEHERTTQAIKATEGIYLLAP